MSGKVITIRNPDVDLIRRLKIATGCNTASQAFVRGGERLIWIEGRYRDALDEIERLQRIVARQQQVLDQARDAAALLVEACGQGDLFFAR